MGFIELISFSNLFKQRIDADEQHAIGAGGKVETLLIQVAEDPVSAHASKRCLVQDDHHYILAATSTPTFKQTG
jgi:hypothetical protein